MKSYRILVSYKKRNIIFKHDSDDDIEKICAVLKPKAEESAKALTGDTEIDESQFSIRIDEMVKKEQPKE